MKGTVLGTVLFAALLVGGTSLAEAGKRTSQRKTRANLNKLKLLNQGTRAGKPKTGVAKTGVKAPKSKALVLTKAVLMKYAPRVGIRKLAGKKAKRRALRLVTRSYRRKDVSGKHDFIVTLSASGYVDRRLLDYLGGHLRIYKKTRPVGRLELALFRTSSARVDPSADELKVTLKGVSRRTDASGFLWFMPSGFQFARPGVLKVKEHLARAMVKNRKFRFAQALKAKPGRSTKMKTTKSGGLTRLKGTLVCTAAGVSKQPLKYIKVKRGSVTVKTDDQGAFAFAGSFSEGKHNLEIIYDSQVPFAGGAKSSGLKIMGDVHSAYSEDRSKNSVSVSGNTVDLGQIELTSRDCELWRLGVIVLEDYHQAVKKSPPAGRLRIKRWSAVHFGTPYAYYDYIVLATNWTSAQSNESSRRRTIFHEFGHTVRHVADGSEIHWGWDNFRWAYARSHSGCEIFNKQYAFNEGWAQYWRQARWGGGGACSGQRPYTYAVGQKIPILEWNESLIGEHLQKLSLAAGAAGDRDRIMVEVLEASPGKIHSMWEFEQKYCAKLKGASKYCFTSGKPRRPKPQSCPPGYHDDGATCRLVNIKSKPSYGRGVGTVPTDCGAGKQLDAGLCYKKCNSGYKGVGPVCWSSCPSGFPDHGAFCGKPKAYGRGGGYPWKFGDKAFSLDGARKRCRKKHAQGCEKWGAIIYPKCRSGFHNVGCCVCSPNCLSGMKDIGVSCAKKSYGRGVGTVPKACKGGKQMDAGLCYKKCSSGYKGIGPVCWGKCPKGFDDHGATCYKAPHIIVKY